jgi:hypothetical protein
MSRCAFNTELNALAKIQHRVECIWRNLDTRHTTAFFVQRLPQMSSAETAPGAVWSAACGIPPVRGQSTSTVRPACIADPSGYRTEPYTRSPAGILADSLLRREVSLLEQKSYQPAQLEPGSRGRCLLGKDGVDALKQHCLELCWRTLDQLIGTLVGPRCCARWKRIEEELKIFLSNLPL